MHQSQSWAVNQHRHSIRCSNPSAVERVPLTSHQIYYQHKKNQQGRVSLHCLREPFDVFRPLKSTLQRCGSSLPHIENSPVTARRNETSVCTERHGCNRVGVSANQDQNGSSNIKTNDRYEMLYAVDSATEKETKNETKNETKREKRNRDGV